METMTENQRKYAKNYQETLIALRDLLITGAEEAIKVGGSPSMFMIESLGGVMGVVISNIIKENPTAQEEIIREDVMNAIFGSCLDTLEMMKAVDNATTKEDREKMN